MTTYVILESEDKSESMVLTKEFLPIPSMKIVKEFSANSWEDAKRVYNDHYGFTTIKELDGAVIVRDRDGRYRRLTSD